MSVLSIFLAVILSLNKAQEVQECNSNPCNFDISEQAVILCGCDVTDCTVNVGEDSAKGIILFTYADSTTLVCGNIDQCQGASILVNQNSSFCAANNQVGPVTVECNGATSCKDMNITSNGADVTVTATAIDSFDEATLSCINGGVCNLVCSSDVESCEGAICEAPGCDCTSGLCPDRTNAPTKAPVVPPPEPTVTEAPPAPVIPTYKRCANAGQCLITPGAQDIVVVTSTEGVSEAIIDCSGFEQCKSNVVIFSAAPKTRIECGTGYQSCDGLVVVLGNLDADDVPPSFTTADFAGNFVSALVECGGVDGCKGALIDVNGIYTNGVEILAFGSKAISEGNVTCSGTPCNLVCNEEVDACDGTGLRGNVILATLPPPRMSKKQVAAQTIIGSPGQTIVLTKNDQNCLIDCSEKDQCKELNEVPFRVFSACNDTTLICGESSCKNAILNFGQITADIPEPYTVNDFSGPKKSLTIECSGAGACLGSIINIIGDYQLDAVINALDSNSLKDALVTSNEDESIINCDNSNSCDKLTINCDLTNNCVCNGGSCLLIRSNSVGVQINTPAPTSQTSSPTARPTQEPTPSPTSPPTSSDLIIYTPDNNGGVFACPNNVNNCILDCNNGDGQCAGSNPTVLLTAANNTQILCDAADACKQLRVYIGDRINLGTLVSNGLNNIYSVSDFSSNNGFGVFVNCSGVAGCYKANIQADFSVSSKIRIETNDVKDALKDAELNIKVKADQTCEIDCGDTQGCNGVIIDADQVCDCLGLSCPALRQSNINYIPNKNNMPNNKVYNNKHYPQFLPTAVIVVLVFGLICLISFCLYYRYFTKKQDKTMKMLQNNDVNIHGYNENKNSAFDTYQAKTLEMENFA